MSAPPASAPISEDAFRVVFFGPPGAGKTALLAVLGMAQEQQLQGRLIDVTQGLAGLRKAVGQPAPDGAPPLALPVTFEPLPSPPNGKGPSASAVLIDCPGKAAAELLANPWQAHARVIDDGIAGEVLLADALVLPLDASAAPEQLDAYFESFGIFLRALEVQRGRRLDTAGLPVFLVLTKCDLLAQPTDTPMDWIERIEERKRDVDARFQVYLTHEGESGQPAFGRIEVHYWATAARRPALVGSAKSRESYGVAELFRQCLEQAAAYRVRQRRAETRLSWTLWASVILVVVMAATTTVQLLRDGRGKSELELRVESFRFSDREPAAERLKSPVVELSRRAALLQKLHDDPGFNSLPTDDHNLVQERLTELREYLDLLEKIPPPRVLMQVRSLPALDKLRDTVEDLPAPEDWADTDAVRRRAERLKDLDALKRAVLAAQQQFRTGSTAADKLLAFEDLTASPESLKDWLSDPQQAIAMSPKADSNPTDHIPGSTSLTYGTVLAFDEVTHARLDWANRRGKLAGVRDALAGLGLVRTVATPPAVMVIPKEFSLDAAKAKAAELAKHYPQFAAEISLDTLPQRLRDDITREANRSYENLLRPVRELVWKQVGTDEDWDKLRSWAEKPSGLEDWRFLVKALTPLLGGPARNTIKELAGFLRETSFPLRATRLVLEVTEDSAALAQPPLNAVLTLEYQKDGDKSKLSFSLDNTKTKKVRVRGIQLTRYVFNRTAGSGILYEPGGDLTATVPVAEGGTLVWKNPQASRVYQIERLSLPPLLLPEGKPETGVRLYADPLDSLPHWPDLLQKPAR